MKSRYYYNFIESIDELTGETYVAGLDVMSKNMEDNLTDFLSNSVMARFKNVFKEVSGVYKFKDYIADLIDIITNLHGENFCVFTNLESSFPSEAKKFIIKFISVIDLTAPRYTKLLSLYASQESKLLDKLESSNSGLAVFNDTPQGSGDFSDDPHATTTTKTSSTSAVEVKTPIERLKEIQEGYSDVLAKWTEEFDKFFLEEVNVNE